MQNKEKFFENLSFERFRLLAQDPFLSCYEKIGFPNAYRQGNEEKIFEDICNKLLALNQQGTIVIDIGPGCSELPCMIIDNAERNEQQLVFIDSGEMLSLLPDRVFLQKIEARYPNCPLVFEKYKGKANAINVYSVLQYIFTEGNIFDFLDRTLELLAPEGRLLLGDIPNISKRKRFFSSERGIEFHQNFTQSNTVPEINNGVVEKGQIDDAVILGILSRARSQGFNAYVLPQGLDLPMENRREDILIERP